MEDFVDDSLLELIEQVEGFIDSLRKFKRRQRLKRLPSIPFDDDAPEDDDAGYRSQHEDIYQKVVVENKHNDIVLRTRHQYTATTPAVPSGVIAVPNGFTVNSNPLPFMKTPPRSTSANLFKPSAVEALELKTVKTPISRTPPVDRSRNPQKRRRSPLKLVQSASMGTPIYGQQKPRKRYLMPCTNTSNVMDSVVTLHPIDRTLRISSTELCCIPSPWPQDDQLESTCLLSGSPHGRHSKYPKVQLLDICDYHENIYDLHDASPDKGILHFVDIPPPPPLPPLKALNKSSTSPLKLSISPVSDRTKQSKSQNSEIKENLANLLMTPKTSSIDIRMNSEVRRLRPRLSFLHSVALLANGMFVA